MIFVNMHLKRANSKIGEFLFQNGWMKLSNKNQLES